MFTVFRKKDRDKLDSLILHTEFTVVDTELTGLNLLKDRVIAIGCIKMKGKTIKVGEIFYRTVNPNSGLKRDSIMIHELTPSELEVCPDITPIVKEFLSFVKDSIVVGHFVSVDIDFLRKEIYKKLKKKYEPLAVDTLVLYRWLIRKGVLPDAFSKNVSLREVSLSLNIEQEKVHNAISDAYVTAQIFQRILVYLTELKINTLKQLLYIGSPDASGYIDAKEKFCYQL